MASRSFGIQSPEIPHLSKGELADLRRDIEEGFLASEQIVEAGHYAMATLLIGTLPTVGDTVTIGTNVYEFGGVGANINVAIGGAVATSRTNLANAINTLGTASVLAEVSAVPGAGVSIFKATSRGGALAKGAGQSLALSETLTAVADIWNQTNLNITGKSAGMNKVAYGKVTIDATNLASDFAVKLDFTPTSVRWIAYAATGAIKTTTALVTLSSQFVVFNANNGGTALVATDYIIWEACE
jgi:hypothetical protein